MESVQCAENRHDAIGRDGQSLGQSRHGAENDPMHLVPAITVEALLEGLQTCGVDAAAIRSRVGLAPRYVDPSEQLPSSVWDHTWAEAAMFDPRPELPSLAAMGVPFGLFGSLDYLSGSARNVRGGLQALSDHFSAAAAGIELALDLAAPDGGSLRIFNAITAPSAFESDEFTTALLLGRFRNVTGGVFRPICVYLTRSALAGSPHAALFDAPVVYGSSHAGFDCDRASLDAEQSTADARLHDVLREIARKLGFANDGRSSFEASVRSRLTSLMPRGQAVAQRVARSLGMSERTLHRRLAASGNSFQGVLDQLRIEESERLLLQGKSDLAAVALALGFSDQAAWNRFFRRLRHMSPTEWRDVHRQTT